MKLSKIKIKNYRLLIDAEIDPQTTLIVGRNNTAKTSCFECICNVLNGNPFSFNDYPLQKRENLYTKIALFMEKKLTLEQLYEQLEPISIELLVDYTLDNPDENLGALSPFIIDVDLDVTTASILVEFRLKNDEKTLWKLLEKSYYKDSTFTPDADAHNVIAENFQKLFELTVYAVNPKNPEEKQVKKHKELEELFPFHIIPAERLLGEDGTQNSSLSALISDFFSANEDELNPSVAEKVKELRLIVETANRSLQQQSDEILKVLMITHKILASQQGYEQLLEILKDGLRDKEDPFLLFFMNTVEPVYKALETSNMQLLFDVLEIKRYPITKKSEKARWKNFHNQLKEVRKKKAIDVFKLVNQSNLIPVPPKLEGYYRLYCDAPETIYAADTSIQSFLNLDYAQFITAIDFLYPDAMFSTEHGVKGEEYDNVVFVIGRGWNQYQFEVYAPMITGQSAIPTGKQASYERNRNLFYVCCSRPKKRLFVFISIPIEPTFRSFLVELVGEQNIFTYSQYLESNMK